MHQHPTNILMTCTAKQAVQGGRSCFRARLPETEQSMGGMSEYASLVQSGDDGKAIEKPGLHVQIKELSC